MRTFTPSSTGMANPMTTGGDTIYGGAGGTPTRLPNGSLGQVYTSGGGTAAPSWTTFAAGFNKTSQTSAYNAAISDWVIASGSGFPITLPDATTVGSSGKSIRVLHNGSNFTGYQIHTTSSQTITSKGNTFSNTDINTSNLVTLWTAGEWIEFQSDGSNWFAYHVAETPRINSGAPVITATSAYTFTITSSSVTLGAVYSNNGQTFTCTVTIASQTTLTCYGTGTPLTSGTLTLVSGTGPATIAFSARTITGVPAIGTAATSRLIWQRIGATWFFELDIVQTGAGTAGSGLYLITLINSLAIDTTTVLTNGASTASAIGTQLGTADISNQSNGFGASTNVATVFAYDATHLAIRLVAGGGTNTYNLLTGSALGNFSTTNSSWAVRGSVQISGWLP